VDEGCGWFVLKTLIIVIISKDYVDAVRVERNSKFVINEYSNFSGLCGMRPSEALNTHREAIRKVVESHRASNVRVFGSVVHGDDTEISDLNLLIDPTEDTTLMDIGAIRYELRELLGVSVDVLTPKALPDSFRSN